MYTETTIDEDESYKFVIFLRALINNFTTLNTKRKTTTHFMLEKIIIT